MELSAEVIQNRVFEDFQAQLDDFHKQCESEYLHNFRRRIIDGDIDVNSAEYRQMCHREALAYSQKLKKDVYQFVRSYVNESFDSIIDSTDEGIFTSEEAIAAQNTLRHILIAAEMEYTKSDKL